MTTINLSKFRADFPDTLVSPQESALATVKCYEFDWSEYAQKLTEISRPEDNPSWLKAVTDVDKAEGIWRGFFESLIGKTSGKLRGTNATDFALNHITGDVVTGVMQFLPANSTNVEAIKVAKLAQALLPDWVVITLNGEAEATNAGSEDLVKDHVIHAQNEGKRGVWVISQGMGSRSFSVPEINTVLLTYDRGDLGATVQKMSRCLTSGAAEKVGHIVSLSIDGNREDKVTGFALETAMKHAKLEEISLEDALRKVRRTIPVFDLDDNGDCVELREDAYLNRAMSITAASRLVVNTHAVFELSDEDLDRVTSILQNVGRQGDRLGNKETPFDVGNRFVEGSPRGENESTKRSDRDKLREEIQEKLKVLQDRQVYLVYFLPDLSSITIEAVLVGAESDMDSCFEFKNVMGISVDEFREFLDLGLINREMIEVVMLQSVPH